MLFKIAFLFTQENPQTATPAWEKVGDKKILDYRLTVTSSRL